MTTMATRLGRNIGRHITVRSFFSDGLGYSVAGRGTAIAPPAGTRCYRSGFVAPQAQDTVRQTCENWLLFGVTGATMGYSFFLDWKRREDLNARIQDLEDRVKKLEERCEELFRGVEKLEKEYGVSGVMKKLVEDSDDGTYEV